jgi:hypothetical protein
MTEHTVGRDTWSQAQARFDGLEAGQAKLEAGQAKLEIRMTNVETRLTMVEHDVADIKVDLRELRRDMHERFDRQATDINARIDRLQAMMMSQTRWTVGTLALFGTLIAILVGIGQLRS